jgi:phosphatidylglycerol---prolipoprotein diacylglyceryl transferase
MYPRLLELGPISIYSYGLLLAAAFLAGLSLASRRARRQGLSPERMLDLGIYIIISAVVGGKLLLLLTDVRQYVQHPSELFSLAQSGGVFYGGLILAVLVSVWYIRRHHMPLWQTCDVFAPGIALGHAIGRVGCLMAGCCYGRPTSAPWGIVFSDAFAASYVGTPLHVHLHPTQLYESAAELLILFTLLAMEKRGRRFAGRTIWAYVLLYAVSRFFIEFFRGDDRGVVFGVSTSQFISLILAPLAVGMLIWLSRRRDPAPVAAAHSAPKKGRAHKATVPEP